MSSAVGADIEDGGGGVGGGGQDGSRRREMDDGAEVRRRSAVSAHECGDRDRGSFGARPRLAVLS